VNKLAEFMVAKPRRQRQILRDQKYPTDFKGMFYRDATEAIASYIASNLEKASIITTAISILSQKRPEKIGTRRRIDANIDALEAFQEMVDVIDLKSAIPSLGSNSPPRLTIRNVEISVRPDIILHVPGKSGVQLTGAIKLHFPMTNSLGVSGEGFVSAMLQRWLRDHIPEDGEPSPAFCYAIDVGAKSVGKGVAATKARFADIEATCQNIVALWPTITPDD
jgi:hypothetical protein